MAHECNCAPIEEVVANIDRRIGDGYWSLIAVEGTASQPPWVYTVGLTERFDHPELIVTASCSSCGGALLNELAARIKAGERLPVPTVEPIFVRGEPVHVRPVHRLQWHHGWFNMWLNYYAEKPWDPPRREAVQIVFANEVGFPWEQPRDGGQVLLDKPTARTVSSLSRRNRRRRK